MWAQPKRKKKTIISKSVLKFQDHIIFFFIILLLKIIFLLNFSNKKKLPCGWCNHMYSKEQNLPYSNREMTTIYRFNFCCFFLLKRIKWNFAGYDIAFLDLRENTNKNHDKLNKKKPFVHLGRIMNSIPVKRTRQKKPIKKKKMHLVKVH